MSAVLCIKLLCSDMEDQPEISSAVTTPLKLGDRENLQLEVRVRAVLAVCTSFSSTFLSNLNISATCMST
jgi:hypothetical protein